MIWGFLRPLVWCRSRYGNGDYGDGWGYVDGNGQGNGYGYGDGHGDGNGHGHGDGGGGP